MKRLLRACILQSLVVVSSLCAGPAIEHQAQSPPADAIKLLWHPPPPMTPSDWYWGAGGEDLAPTPPFRFIKEDFGGTNPKVKVKDARGREWTVKFGHEVHSDTFTPRLVYAAGYFAEPTYFVREGVIEGAHHLKRAKPFITKKGAFRYARFKFHDKNALPYADDYTWSWKDNPFVGSRELSGLKILMMLTSNWDAQDITNKDTNTAVFRRLADSAYLYVFTDWGSTMGKWGGYFRRDKWDCYGYERQTKKLIKAVKNGEIEWGFSGKHKQDLTQGIRLEDVRWIVSYLSRFTDADIRAGLVASGANQTQIKVFTRAIDERIAELEQVSEVREASSKLP